MTPRPRRLYFAEARTAAALVCATVVTLICLGEQHFTINRASLASPHLIDQHRCGRLFLLALAWLAIETTHLCFRWLFPVAHPNPHEPLRLPLRMLPGAPGPDSRTRA
jgi:hypothetical protein